MKIIAAISNEVNKIERMILGEMIIREVKGRSS